MNEFDPEISPVLANEIRMLPTEVEIQRVWALKWTLVVLKGRLPLFAGTFRSKKAALASAAEVIELVDQRLEDAARSATDRY